MKLIRCDQCRKEIEEYAQFGWYRVEQDQDSRTVGDAPGPFNFCGLACLATWAVMANRVPSPALLDEFRRHLIAQGVV